MTKPNNAYDEIERLACRTLERISVECETGRNGPPPKSLFSISQLIGQMLRITFERTKTMGATDDEPTEWITLVVPIHGVKLHGRRSMRPSIVFMVPEIVVGMGPDDAFDLHLRQVKITEVQDAERTLEFELLAGSYLTNPDDPHDATTYDRWLNHRQLRNLRVQIIWS